RHTRFSRDWSSDVCSSDLLFLTSLFRRPNSVVTPLASPEAQAARAAVNPNVPPRGISSLDALTQLAAINAQAAAESTAKSDPARSEERRVGKECRSEMEAD